MQPADVTTHADPSGNWEGLDAAGRAVSLCWWKQLILKEVDWLPLTVIRVQRHNGKGIKRARVSWSVWIDNQEVDLPLIVLGYVHRFSQEHGYRFDKQSLLWNKPAVRTPEQFERWSHLVAIAHNLLVLAQKVVAPELRP